MTDGTWDALEPERGTMQQLRRNKEAEAEKGELRELLTLADELYEAGASVGYFEDSLELRKPHEEKAKGILRRIDELLSRPRPAILDRMERMERMEKENERFRTAVNALFKQLQTVCFGCSDRGDIRQGPPEKTCKRAVCAIKMTLLEARQALEGSEES